MEKHEFTILELQQHHDKEAKALVEKYQGGYYRTFRGVTELENIREKEKNEELDQLRRRSVEFERQLKTREEALTLEVQTKEEQLAEARNQLQECNYKLEAQRREKGTNIEAETQTEPPSPQTTTELGDVERENPARNEGSSNGYESTGTGSEKPSTMCK